MCEEAEGKSPRRDAREGRSIGESGARSAPFSPTRSSEASNELADNSRIVGVENIGNGQNPAIDDDRVDADNLTKGTVRPPFKRFDVFCLVRIATEHRLP